MVHIFKTRQKNFPEQMALVTVICLVGLPKVVIHSAQHFLQGSLLGINQGIHEHRGAGEQVDTHESKSLIIQSIAC